MTPVALAIWLVVLAGVLAVVGLALRTERRWFASRGKAASWLRLRLLTLPIGGVAILLAWSSNQTVGGVEPLAVFMISLVTVVPLFYFGLHWFLGRWMNPPLTGGESVWIALSGLLIVLWGSGLISMANPWVHSILRGIA